MKFKDIKPFTSDGSYAVDQPLIRLVETIERYQREYGFDMEADFQRPHVWTEQQQIAFVEFFLRGGKVGPIYCNAKGWRQTKGPIEVVDGKQRINACLRFLKSEIPVFGSLYKDYEDDFGWLFTLRFVINDLPTRKDVLQWYLDLNSGGTPHSPEELERVKNLLNSA